MRSDGYFVPADLDALRMESELLTLENTYLEQQLAKARDRGDARAERNAEEALTARRAWLTEAENTLAEFSS